MHTDTISKSIPQLFIQLKLQKSIHSRSVLLYPNWPHLFSNERTNECTYGWGKKCTELHLARRFHFRNMKYQLQFIGFAHKNMKPLHNADVIIHIFIFEAMECGCADWCGGSETERASASDQSTKLKWICVRALTALSDIESGAGSQNVCSV